MIQASGERKSQSLMQPSCPQAAMQDLTPKSHNYLPKTRLVYKGNFCEIESLKPKGLKPEVSLHPKQGKTVALKLSRC